MTTMALTVAAVRRMLKDYPSVLVLGAAQSDTTDETTTLVAGQATQLSNGMRLEHDDGTGEQRYVIDTDPATETFEGLRGYYDSTASTHSNSSRVLVEPRFTYDQVVQNVNHVLNSVLPDEDIFDIVEETIASSSLTNQYNAASTACEEHLSIYQFPSSSTEALWLRAGQFATAYENVNTAHFSTGKMFTINGQRGTAGTDPYFVNCRHPITISTLTGEQELLVQYLVVAMVMEQENPQRTGGRTPFADRTVRGAEFVQSAGWYRAQAKAIIKSERSRLYQMTKPRRRFVRNR